MCNRYSVTSTFFLSALKYSGKEYKDLSKSSKYIGENLFYRKWTKQASEVRWHDSKGPVGLQEGRFSVQCGRHKKTWPLIFPIGSDVVMEGMKQSLLVKLTCPETVCVVETAGKGPVTIRTWRHVRKTPLWEFLKDREVMRSETFHKR